METESRARARSLPLGTTRRQQLLEPVNLSARRTGPSGRARRRIPGTGAPWKTSSRQPESFLCALVARVRLDSERIIPTLRDAVASLRPPSNLTNQQRGGHRATRYSRGRDEAVVSPASISRPRDRLLRSYLQPEYQHVVVAVEGISPKEPSHRAE